MRAAFQILAIPYRIIDGSPFIVYTLRKALVKSYLGKEVDIRIDRPIGSTHPKHPDLTYPINYGYIPNVLGGDGEELAVHFNLISCHCRFPFFACLANCLLIGVLKTA